MMGRRLFVGFALVVIAAAASGANAAQMTAKDGVEALRRGDAARAVAIWRALAIKGDPDAQFDLGQAYRFGRGVRPDAAESKRLFEAAARAGHLQAQVSLGLLLFDTGDRTTAFVWLKRAADRGDARAQLVTGTAMFNGDGMKRDPILGYAYVRRSAAQGFSPAVATLADMENVLTAEDRKQAMTMVGVSAKPAKTKVAAKPIAPPPPVKVARPEPVKVPQPAPTSSAGGWRVQLGAFGNRGSAQSLFARLAPKLGGAQGYYIPVGAMTRLQAGPFASSAAAAQACARLKPQPCFPVAAR